MTPTRKWAGGRGIWIAVLSAAIAFGTALPVQAHDDALMSYDKWPPGVAVVLTALTTDHELLDSAPTAAIALEPVSARVAPQASGEARAQFLLRTAYLLPPARAPPW